MYCYNNNIFVVIFVTYKCYAHTPNILNANKSNNQVFAYSPHTVKIDRRIIQ